jgi:hypothetical protein
MKTVHSLSEEENSLSKPQASPKSDGREKPLLIESPGTTAASSVDLSALDTVARTSSTQGTQDAWDTTAEFAHVLDIEYISQKLNVNVRYGLSKEDAAHRLAQTGPSKRHLVYRSIYFFRIESF